MKDILINFTTNCFSLLKLLLSVSLSLSASWPAVLVNFTKLSIEDSKQKLPYLKSYLFASAVSSTSNYKCHQLEKGRADML